MRSRRRTKSTGALPLVIAGFVAVAGLGGIVGTMYYVGRLKESQRIDHPAPRKVIVVKQSPKTSSAKVVPDDAVGLSEGAVLAMLPPLELARPLPKGSVQLPRDRPVADDIRPEPVDGLVAHAGDEQTVDSLIVTPAKLPAARVAPSLVWHPDGMGFFYLEASGTLRLLAFPTLKEERVLRIGQRANRLAICDKGLLVVLPEAQELWLLDWNGLDIKARVGITGIQDVVSAFPLKSALAFCKEGNPVVVDFDGEAPRLGDAMVEHDSTTSLPASVRGFAFPAFDAEGKRLFAIGTGEQILRYRVEGRTIFLESASPKVGAKGRRAPLCISPDGKSVCAPGGIKAGETAIFDTARLDAPALTLAFGPPATAVAFSPGEGRIYTQNNRFALIAADTKGTKLAELPVIPGTTAPEVFQILVHPEGKKLVLLTSRGLYLVRPTSSAN